MRWKLNFLFERYKQSTVTSRLYNNKNNIIRSLFVNTFYFQRIIQELGIKTGIENSTFIKSIFYKIYLVNFQLNYNYYTKHYRKPVRDNQKTIETAILANNSG